LTHTLASYTRASTVKVRGAVTVLWGVCAGVASSPAEVMLLMVTVERVFPQVALMYASLVNQAGEAVGVSLISQNLAASSQAALFFAYPGLLEAPTP
jgi:hypothetical protein